MHEPPVVRNRLLILGLVQGVGFRPFVWRRARRFGLVGWVENFRGGLIAEVQGPARSVAGFLQDFIAAAPPLAVIERIEVEEVAADPAAISFMILESESPDLGPLAGSATAVPPDIATCAACLAELFDSSDRRHRHAFINCTDCGPRFTIIRGLPYDRPLTTMRGFALCDDCAGEYADPADRRFHAQPIACPACGPTIRISFPDEATAAGGRSPEKIGGDAALRAAQHMLRAGQILAVKGVGGFHLVCDATNDAAVGLLRDRKGRVGKPLAVMVGDIAAARAIARIDEQERRLLESRERPIVLLGKREAPEPVSADVSPGNAFLGVMLAHSPLHHLLCAGMPPLVVTSGNLAEEPIVHDDEVAIERLAPLADAFLLHDRPIEAACDDSVVRCAAGITMPIRRSRGYAPLPIRLASSGPAVLAVGGELKAALCLVDGDRAIMSQHIGDMGNLETLAALGSTAEHLMRLFQIAPAVIAADIHPGSLSTGWARRFAAERGIPLVLVQHHEAHLASLLAEHGRQIDALIGVCFDGTGYGRDGMIWGGEFFLAADDGLQRAAHLEPFPLPGGDASIRHPWRTALATLHAARAAWDETLAPVRQAGANRLLLARQLERNLNCVATSSMGRLFDAVAALVGVRQSISYEAEAAMNLEAVAAGAGDSAGAYRFSIGTGLVDSGGPIGSDGPIRIDWRPVLREILAELRGGEPAARIAARFHRGVARMIADVCSGLRGRGAADTVGLSGGVFQNALLLELATDALHDAGFEVLVHQRVPANDGGLALGQAMLARAERANT